MNFKTKKIANTHFPHSNFYHTREKRKVNRTFAQIYLSFRNTTPRQVQRNPPYSPSGPLAHLLFHGLIPLGDSDLFFHLLVRHAQTEFVPVKLPAVISGGKKKKDQRDTESRSEDDVLHFQYSGLKFHLAESTERRDLKRRKDKRKDKKKKTRGPRVA